MVLCGKSSPLLRLGLTGWLAGLAVWGLVASAARSEPVLPFTYFNNGNPARALALDPTNNVLYWISYTNTGTNVFVFALDPAGNVLTPAIFSNTIGSRLVGAALNTQLVPGRLYLASELGGAGMEIQVGTLDGSGNPALSQGYDFFATGAEALALDAQRRQLYVAVNDSVTGIGLGTVELNPAGDPVGYRSVTTSASGYSLALDSARNKLYLGCGDGYVRTYNLDPLTGRVGGPCGLLQPGFGRHPFIALRRN